VGLTLLHSSGLYCVAVVYRTLGRLTLRSNSDNPFTDSRYAVVYVTAWQIHVVVGRGPREQRIEGSRRDAPMEAGAGAQVDVGLALCVPQVLRDQTGHRVAPRAKHGRLGPADGFG